MQKLLPVALEGILDVLPVPKVAESPKGESWDF